MMTLVLFPMSRRISSILLGSLLLGVLVGPSIACPPLSLLRRQSLSTGLVAYWPLDTITGGTTTPDTSGSAPANTATLTGGPTTAAGKIANGFTFAAASSQYLSVADATSLQFGTGDFTVALWMKPANLTTKMRVINKWDSTPAK